MYGVGRVLKPYHPGDAFVNLIRPPSEGYIDHVLVPVRSRVSHKVLFVLTESGLQCTHVKSSTSWERVWYLPWRSLSISIKDANLLFRCGSDKRFVECVNAAAAEELLSRLQKGRLNFD